MELLDTWRDRLIAIHISDRAGIVETHLLPGEGYIDFTEMTEILRTIPFSIPVLLEVDMKYSKYTDAHWFLQQAYDAASELESSIRTNGLN